MSSAKVVSWEIDLRAWSGLTGRASTPRARCQSRSPSEPKRRIRALRSRARRSAMLRMPSDCSAARAAWPTPQISETGWRARKSRVSARPMMAKPRGLSRSEAILARNLLCERPTETVMPSSASMRDCRRARRTAGGRVVQALGAGEVEEGLVERERLDQRGQLEHHGADGAGDLEVALHPGRHHHRLGAELQRLEHRHGGADALDAGDVAGGGDDAAAAAADDDRAVAQARVVALLDRGIEGVAVEMGDGRGCGARGGPGCGGCGRPGSAPGPRRRPGSRGRGSGRGPSRQHSRRPGAAGGRTVAASSGAGQDSPLKPAGNRRLLAVRDRILGRHREPDLS